jgi:hypothetical protein
MKIDQRSDTCVYITINGRVYYIDDSTNEQIVSRWPECDCTGICYCDHEVYHLILSNDAGVSTMPQSTTFERFSTSYTANRTPDYAIVISLQTDAPDPLRPFAVHTEIFPENDAPTYLVSGQYDLTLNEARMQFWERVKHDSSLSRTNSGPVDISIATSVQSSVRNENEEEQHDPYVSG